MLDVITDVVAAENVGVVGVADACICVAGKRFSVKIARFESLTLFAECSVFAIIGTTQVAR